MRQVLLVAWMVAVTGVLGWLLWQEVNAKSGRAPVSSPAQQSVVAVSNTAGDSIGLVEGRWTVVQEIDISVAGPGNVYLSAFGGEPVVQILPVDSFRFTGLQTLIGIGPTDAASPQATATFSTACCGDRPFPYRVSAYSVAGEFRLSGPGTYHYAVYAISPKEGDGETAVRPATFTATFIPD